MTYSLQTALETYKTWSEVIAKEHWVSFPSHVMLYHGTHSRWRPVEKSAALG